MKIIGEKLSNDQLLKVKGGAEFTCYCSQSTLPLFRYSVQAYNIPEAEHYMNEEHCRVTPGDYAICEAVILS